MYVKYNCSGTFNSATEVTGNKFLQEILNACISIEIYVNILEVSERNGEKCVNQVAEWP